MNWENYVKNQQFDADVLYCNIKNHDYLAIRHLETNVNDILT